MNKCIKLFGCNRKDGGVVGTVGEVGGSSGGIAKSCSRAVYLWLLQLCAREGVSGRWVCVRCTARGGGRGGPSHEPLCHKMEHQEDEEKQQQH